LAVVDVTEVTVGAVVSTTTLSAGDWDELLPESSICVAVIDHDVPRMLGIVQVAADADTLALHCCFTELGPVATNSTTPPSSLVVVDTSKLVAVVRLSVSEVPVSEPAARSGAVGADGAVASMVAADVPVARCSAG
jgi:hypothetical protein